jgi:hypothetical protein
MTPQLDVHLVADAFGANGERSVGYLDAENFVRRRAFSEFLETC